MFIAAVLITKLFAWGGGLAALALVKHVGPGVGDDGPPGGPCLPAARAFQASGFPAKFYFLPTLGNMKHSRFGLAQVEK